MRLSFLKPWARRKLEEDGRIDVDDTLEFGSPAWYRHNYSRLTEHQRAECRRVIQMALSGKDKIQLWMLMEEHGPDKWFDALGPGAHMFFGMGVRNLLRTVVKDDDLPPVRYPSGDYHRNWDDFYVQALEDALTNW